MWKGETQNVSANAGRSWVIRMQLTYMPTYKHTHPHIQTHTHECIHACMHVYICTYVLIPA